MSNTIINTNVAALNSHRSMKVVGEATGKASEKLSSGLRINRAADDAAGLAISEKMRSQVRGLNQASRNAQDGISLIQTAEGALQETEDMLQRMRELVVQGANDSNTQSDRDKIALELDELIDEIDATADKTEFNTKKLIDGSWSEAKLYFQVGANSGQSIEFNIDQMNSKLLGVTKDKISDVVNGKTIEDALPGTISGVNDIDFSLKGADAFDDKAGTYQFANGAKLTVNEDGTIALEGDFYIKTSGGTPYNKISEGALASIKTLDDLRSAIGVGNELVFDEEGQNAESKISVDATDDILKITQASTNGSGSSLAAETKNALDGTGGATSGLVSLSKNNATTIDAPAAGEASLSWMEDASGNLSYSFTFSKDDKITFLGTDAEGNDVDISDLFESGKMYTGAELAGMGLTGIRGSNGVQIDFDGGELDSSTVTETVMFTPANAAVDTSVGKEISKLTSVLDNAIEMVSSQRAKLGAYQNRMEHTIKNLDTSSENLSAAESRVRDTDMAKEMMSFTKSNVLSQAAMSMLAQANQAPNNILSLLR